MKKKVHIYINQRNYKFLLDVYNKVYV